MLFKKISPEITERFFQGADNLYKLLIYKLDLF